MYLKSHNHHTKMAQKHIPDFNNNQPTQRGLNVLTQDKYLDPPDAAHILERMRQVRTMGELKGIADAAFPDWFVTTMEVYCPDYPHLQQNWYKVCQKIGVRPTQIMIVEDILHDEDHSVVANFAECFTRAGFSVKRKYEFIPCENCGSAVPTQLMWQLLSEKGFTVPNTWSEKCVGCQ